jgi:hypothetical protein
VPLLEFARDLRLGGGAGELNGAGCGKEENNWFHRTEGYDVAAIPSTKRPTNQRRGCTWKKSA